MLQGFQEAKSMQFCYFLMVSMAPQMTHSLLNSSAQCVSSPAATACFPHATNNRTIMHRTSC